MTLYLIQSVSLHGGIVHLDYSCDGWKKMEILKGQTTMNLRGQEGLGCSLGGLGVSIEVSFLQYPRKHKDGCHLWFDQWQI